MKRRTELKNRIACRVVPTALITVLTAAFMITAQRPSHADEIAPPWVPENIQVPPGNKAFFAGHAVGTQNYICLPSGAGYAWTFFGPQATLFDDAGLQVTTHFLSANPMEGGTLRPTWQHSRDTSAVWAQSIASADVQTIGPAIPWLLLRVVGAGNGPTGGDKLTQATFIHRLNTVGGVAPTTGCAEPRNVGSKMFVPYTAEYIFYKAAGNSGRN